MSAPRFSLVAKSDYVKFHPDVKPEDIGLRETNMRIGDEEIPVLYFVTDGDGDWNMREAIRETFFLPKLEDVEWTDAIGLFDELYYDLEMYRYYGDEDIHKSVTITEYRREWVANYKAETNGDPEKYVEETIAKLIGDDPDYIEFLKAYQAYRWFENSPYGMGGGWN